MSREATQAQQQPSTSHPLTSGGILQRKCESCEQHVIAGGTCKECSQQRQGLQQQRTNSVSEDFHHNEMLDWTGSGVNYNFSQVRAFTDPKVSAKSAPFVQTKLTIGQPGDRYEQEADRVADQVMRMSDPMRTAVTPVRQLSIQRLCPECEEELQRQPQKSEEDDEKKKRLQMKPISAPNRDESPDLEARITSLKQSGGRPLSASERAFLEPRFGQDFSRVRIHSDAQAAEMAQAVNARAFTVGRDVVFGAGQYQPSAPEGKRLLAHELTHVVQQSGQVSLPPTNSPANTPNNLSDRDPLAVQSINTVAESQPAILQQSSKAIMREALFSSTMEICHRLLKSRVFHVSQGGLVVNANARWEASPEWQGTEAPQCGRGFYNMTLNQEGLIFDSEYGSCEFEMGSPFSRTWTKLPEGDYYLTTWTNNTNPNCCLRGDIEVSQQSGLKGESC